MEATWQNVFQVLILGLVALIGSPFVQFIKNGLSAIFKKPIEDRYALALTGVISAGFALLEMWLSGALNFGTITLDSFPLTFFAVLGVTSVYYAWFKNSDGALGKGLLLKNSG